MTLLTNPCHPGEVLAELYLAPLGMSALALAKRLDVPRTRIERLVKGETALSVDTAMRLSKFSAPPPSSGSTCSARTIWPEPGTLSICPESRR